MTRHPVPHYHLLLLITTWLTTPTSCVDIRGRALPNDFCYSNPACDHSSNAWPESCKGDHKAQSPIDLKVEMTNTAKLIRVPLPLTRGFTTDRFFLQNNGHTVNLELPIEHAEGSTFFPGGGFTDIKYRLANAHFHWGKDDKGGSEHTLGGARFSMEMHLVHYNTKYRNAQTAIESGDKDALAVIGIFLQVAPNAAPNPALAPIISSLKWIYQVRDYWTKVDEGIDLGPLLPRVGDIVFNYKGSLTTPGCNEQVNWFLILKPHEISGSDVEAFRGVLDGDNRTLLENYRPVQPLFGRQMKILVIDDGGVEIEGFSKSTFGGELHFSGSHWRPKK